MAIDYTLSRQAGAIEAADRKEEQQNGTHNTSDNDKIIQAINNRLKNMTEKQLRLVLIAVAAMFD